MLKKLEMLKEKVAAYCFGDSGLKLKANAPPTIPKIAPTKNPPIPKKLMAENNNYCAPNQMLTRMRTQHYRADYHYDA
jgi:hypothetical protein